MVANTESSEWKDVPGLVLWQAHPSGVLRTKTPALNRGVQPKTPPSILDDWRMVKPRTMEIGYLCVVAMPLGKTVYVHRLIAATFLGQPAPGSKLEVNHKNGIKTDNRVENLEWVTRRQNCRHKCRILGYRGENTGHTKLSEDAVIELLLLYWMRAESISMLARRFGIAIGSVNDIIYNKTWRHLERPAPNLIAKTACEIPEADAAMATW